MAYYFQVSIVKFVGAFFEKDSFKRLIQSLENESNIEMSNFI